MDWLTGIQNAINYIEENLTEKIDYDEAAKQASCSSFYFQRIFSILCGITLGDYIRNRRLTLAGNELSATDNKVIDIALKYGYESPESFTRAFSKFHGITPSDAKKDGSKLKSFSRLSVKIILSGGNIMDYKIIEKAAFDIIEKHIPLITLKMRKAFLTFGRDPIMTVRLKTYLILQLTEPTFSVYVTEIYLKMQKHLIILLLRNAIRTQ
jgi:AraC-like DNA-binding protein